MSVDATIDRLISVLHAHASESDVTAFMDQLNVVMDERDAAIARAEAAEALAASRLEVSPEDAAAYDKFVIAMFDGNAIPMAVWTRAERARAALRAHAAKVSR